MNTKFIYNSKTDLCNQRKKFPANLISEAEKQEYKRATLLREAILSFKLKGKSKGESLNLLKEEINGEKFACYNSATKNELLDEVTTLFKKFISAQPEKALPVVAESFEFEGKLFTSCPDFVYDLGKRKVNTAERGEIELPVIKVVDLTTGRQKMSTKNPKKDTQTKSAYHSIKTLGLIEFAKNFLKGNGVAIISYTALKTSNDHNGDYSKAWSVAKSDTSGGYTNNEVNFSVLFIDGKFATFTGSSIDFNRVYDNIKETLKTYEKGENLKGSEDCKDCMYNNICNFAYPPVKKPEVPAVKRSKKEVKLTAEQKKVVNFEGGVAVVDAGAGSGKSQSVTMHVLKLFEEGLNPEDLMILSFSNSATEVLKERIVKAVEENSLEVEAKNIKIATFNGVGDEIVKENYLRLGFKEKPNLIDSIENYDMILKSIDWDNPIDGFDYRNPNMYISKKVRGVGKELEEIFASIRNNNLGEDDIKRKYQEETGKKIWETYQRYENLLKENNFYDFADQSNLVKKLLEEDPFILADIYSPKVVIVDEFQDSNDFQMEFLKALTYSANFRELLVVGDSSQAIYGFRGTSPRNIINFEELMDMDCSDFKLTINHRSAKKIVEKSNFVSAISNRFMIEETGSGISVKNMSSSREIDGEYTLTPYTSKNEEIEGIAGKIKKLVDKGEKPENIAVLSHNKYFLNSMRKALADLDIRSQFDMPETLISNFRVLSAIGLAEYIKEGATKGLFEYLNAFYETKLSKLPCDDIERVITRNMKAFEFYYLLENDEDKITVITNLLKCLDNEDDAVYTAFIDMVCNKKNYTSNMLLDYIIKLKTYNSTEGALKGGEYEAVALSTIHSSKGKEWKYVFGTLSDFSDEERNAESWRLLYVLMTRACDSLEISAVHAMDKNEKVVNVNIFFSALQCENDRENDRE